MRHGRADGSIEDPCHLDMLPKRRISVDRLLKQRGRGSNPVAGLEPTPVRIRGETNDHRVSRALLPATTT